MSDSVRNIRLGFVEVLMAAVLLTAVVRVAAAAIFALNTYSAQFEDADNSAPECTSMT